MAVNETKTILCQLQQYNNMAIQQFYTTSYPELVLKLRKEIIRIHNENNCKIILVGHSLGGLIISGAANDPEIKKMVSGLITIGTPFKGSVLGADCYGTFRQKPSSFQFIVLKVITRSHTPTNISKNSNNIANR